MALPRYIVLKSKYNEKYLCCKVENYLQFVGEEVANPQARFEVETAKSDNELVHIRCCFNNKYWVRYSGGDAKPLIIAAAKEPEEDRSKWTCTLFKPIFMDDGPDSIRFRHVQNGHYACLWRETVPACNCLIGGSADTDEHEFDPWTVIDWESVVVLPRYVAFKGDNGKYLSARWVERHQYMQFACDDLGDPSVGFEIFPVGDGSIRVKSDYFRRFWRRSPNWIWADTDDTSSRNRDTLFWPVKVDENIISLRNAGNNYFCKRLTTEGKTSCLNAAVPTIAREARLEVAELVLSRKIYNVNFRLMDSRIYDQRQLTMATGVAVNGTSQPNNVEVRLSYRETKRSSWETGVSLKLGVKAKFQTRIPFIVKGKVEASAEMAGSHEWGQTTEQTTQVDTVYRAVASPRTTLTVRLLATMGSAEVPFSYSQHDTLINGKRVTSKMNDGKYTCSNCFNFRYETEEQTL